MIKPEEEDVPKIKPEVEVAPKIKPEEEDVPKIKPGVDLSDAKVAEEKDDEGFRCANFANCPNNPKATNFAHCHNNPKAKIASRVRENKISGDAKDAEEVARPEADLSMSKVAEGGVSIAKDAEKIAAVAKAAEEVAKPEVVTVQPEPAQLLDLSTSKDVEVVRRDTKSAAQVFMEEKVGKIKTKQKIEAKLALLKKEVKMGQQLLQQAKTLLKGKEALVQRKVRVTYNQCHKFWRGHVIFAHKSDVDEQVDAAKTRLGLGKSGIKFDIPAMVQKIDELAPGARYGSANPLPPPSTSTSRPRFKTSAPRRSPPSPRRTRSLAIPAPPVLFSSLAKRSSAPAWYRGDHCTVSYGDTIAEDLCLDNLTQLEHCNDKHEDQVDDSFTC